MITPDELKAYPIFASLSDDWRYKVAQTAAELVVQAGEWVIREGEAPSFFVLLSGSLACEKDHGGTNKVRAMYVPGDFYGEIPILLDSLTIASLQAVEPSRLLRLERIQFKDMIASSLRCNEIVVGVMTRRLKMIQSHIQESESLRVRVVGSRYNPECREIRDFLSQNHISYRWTDDGPTGSEEPESFGEPFVIVDQNKVVGCPLTVRKVAEALGMQTTPTNSSYDLVIVGGGPAGLAAAVNGASEGLRVLLVEKKGIGGQAACSSRIENYPGFPTGISGNDLGARAFKQALQFGAEVAMTREVQAIVPKHDGYRIQMDGGCEVQARAVLLATGVQWRTLQVPGLRPLIGKGVLYGAARTEAHAAIGKDIFIIGAGNSAGQAATFFSSYAKHVTLLVRGSGLVDSMSQYLIDQLAKRPNISIEPNTELVSASGDAHLESICTITDAKLRVRDAAALYVMIGATATSSWMPVDLQRDKNGFVCTGQDVHVPFHQHRPSLLETSLPGVFCVGDIRHDSVKRVASGIGEGSMVISFIHKYLDRQPENDQSIDGQNSSMFSQAVA